MPVSAATNIRQLMGENTPGPESKDAVVLSFPYEGTVSYGTGTAKGPEVILDNLATQVEMYDTELRTSPCEKFGMFAQEIEPIHGSSEAAHEIILERTKKAAAEYSNTFFVGLGGEHAVTYPFVKGLLESGTIPKDTAVLQIDAHSDLRDAYEDNPLSHASVMRRLRDDLNLETVHVGIRAIGDDEPAYIKQNTVPVFYAPFNLKQIPEIMKSLPQNIFITFDVDALDPSIMPSTGTPVPGGLLWNEALALLKAAFTEKNVVGMDMVELAPIAGLHAPDFLVASLLYKCFGYKFCL